MGNLKRKHYNDQRARKAKVEAKARGIHWGFECEQVIEKKTSELESRRRSKINKEIKLKVEFTLHSLRVQIHSHQHQLFFFWN